MEAIPPAFGFVTVFFLSQKSGEPQCAWWNAQRYGTLEKIGISESYGLLPMSNGEGTTQAPSYKWMTGFFPPSFLQISKRKVKKSYYRYLPRFTLIFCKWGIMDPVKVPHFLFLRKLHLQTRLFRLVKRILTATPRILLSEN